jgi:vitamin B12 transporter
MIRVVFKSIVLVAVFLVSVSAWAQGTLKGVVLDQLGGVIKGAKVTLEKGDAKANETATDGSGVYNFTSVASGRYHVQIEASGFLSYRSTDMFVGAGSSTANATLTITPLRQEIVVSATGSEVPIAQVGASVTLVDKPQIDAENKLDVLENLRQISGIQVVQTGQRGGNTSLFIRGGESSFNKILIDGVPANAIGGGFDFAQLSNGGVESIEVLRGANSVLYGADALAGVVNITTQRGESETPELKLWADGGNFQTHNKAASIAGAYHRFDYYSLFSRFDTQEISA